MQYYLVISIVHFKCWRFFFVLSSQQTRNNKILKLEFNILAVVVVVVIRPHALRRRQQHAVRVSERQKT